jgi:hypothetical protein
VNTFFIGRHSSLLDDSPFRSDLRRFVKRTLLLDPNGHGAATSV